MSFNGLAEFICGVHAPLLDTSNHQLGHHTCSLPPKALLPPNMSLVDFCNTYELSDSMYTKLLHGHWQPSPLTQGLRWRTRAGWQADHWTNYGHMQCWGTISWGFPVVIQCSSQNQMCYNKMQCILRHDYKYPEWQKNPHVISGVMTVTAMYNL